MDLAVSNQERDSAFVKWWSSEGAVVDMRRGRDEAMEGWDAAWAVQEEKVESERESYRELGRQRQDALDQKRWVEQERDRLREALEELLPVDPFDPNDPYRCFWCNERSKHREDCAWVRAKEALGER
jgi:hypothetical protein